MLAVNQWDEDKDTLASFAKDLKLHQRILLNGSSVGRGLYGVGGVPASFWIDRSGVVVDSHVDFDGPELLDRKTKKLISSR